MYDGQPYISTGAVVRFILRNSTVTVAKTAAFIDGVGNVEYQPDVDDRELVGEFCQEWEVTKNGEVLTFPNDGFNRVVILPDLA